MKKKIDIVEKISIVEKVTFEFAYYENVMNVAMALAMSGQYIRIRKDGSKYILIVYTDRVK